MRTLRIAALAACLAAGASAQAPQFSTAVRAFIVHDQPLIVLTNARVIDGTGAAPRENQTLVIRNGVIESVGDAGRVRPPAGATTLDLKGKTVIPGLVMVHEHLYYPTGGQVYAQLGASFSRLYLAGGVTTMRTGGNMNGVMDIKLKQEIEAGRQAGPAIDATAPYLNGPNPFIQMHGLSDVDDARMQVDYWVKMGATSFKAYMQITRAQLAAAIQEAHKRGIKVTGHLCSVTYAEAADLGIDNLEHGFLASTDFVADKKPDQCPGQGAGQQSIAALDENGAPFKALVKKLIDRNVALTSTLTVFETFTPGRPKPPGLDVLVAPLREQYERVYERVSGNADSRYAQLFPKAMALERAFARAGGLLIAGTDPTGSGGVIPGYSNGRQIELLVEAGFTPVEAIQIATSNGAKYLGREARIGTIAAGRQADLVIVNGNPAAAISDIRNVELVFKQGIGFDPQKLIESVRGRVGLW
ncbi:MAG TPA: amidohydrolase family protein [Vicinamibacterales bacterium]|nr:amidohydrolase family protein [Vicinamibacterales bacterium]